MLGNSLEKPQPAKALYSGNNASGFTYNEGAAAAAIAPVWGFRVG